MPGAEVRVILLPDLRRLTQSHSRFRRLQVGPRSLAVWDGKKPRPKSWVGSDRSKQPDVFDGPGSSGTIPPSFRRSPQDRIPVSLLPGPPPPTRPPPDRTTPLQRVMLRHTKRSFRSGSLGRLREPGNLPRRFFLSLFRKGLRLFHSFLLFNWLVWNQSTGIPPEYGYPATRTLRQCLAKWRRRSNGTRGKRLKSFDRSVQ